MKIPIVIAAVLLIAILVGFVMYRPTCGEVLGAYIGHEWARSWRTGDTSPVPTWARDLREVPCRDGVVRFWKGEPPPNTTVPLFQRSGSALSVPAVESVVGDGLV